jgi:hypothetical protein
MIRNPRRLVKQTLWVASALAASAAWALSQTPAPGPLSPMGGVIDAGKWNFRKLLPVASPGVQQVELDQDTLAHANADLSDIRIVQGGRQIPFILERTSIIRAVPISAAQEKDPGRPSRSLWELKLPQPLPLADVTCASSSPLFERTMRLGEEVPDDRGATFSVDLGGAVWKRTPGDGQRVFVLPLDKPPRSALLNLETDNGDNAPIDLNTFEGHYPATRAIFKTGGGSEPIWLCYGNQEAGFPSYDLRLIAGDLLRAERNSITAGPQKITEGAAAKAAEAITGASKYLFWGALTLVVVALLVITAKLLPKPDKTG